MGKFICVVSGKGGTGKTTVTANIASALALMGRDTLIIDADLGLRNMDLALNLQDKVVYDILDLSLGDCKTREAIIENTGYPHLFFLPASQFKDENTISCDQMKIVADKIREKYEFILIDCPAGLGDIVKASISVSDMAIVVVNPDPFSIRDADRMADLVSKQGIEEVKMIINRYKESMIKDKKMPNFMEIIDAVAVEIIGAIPESEEILLSIFNGSPIAFEDTKKESSYYRDIAKRIVGHKIPILEINPKKKGFWARFKK